MSKSLNIFVVDESMQLCRDLRSWLEQDGHEVNCGQVSAVLLSALESLSPDLIVIAVARYGGAGMNLFRKLTNNRHLKHVPLIAVSEDADLEYEMLDILDFQTRPFDRSRLLLGLRRLAENKGKPSRLTIVEPKSLQAFKDYLLKHSALHFNQNNQRILERALVRRVQALQLDSLQAYFKYLSAPSENYDELNKLIGLLTVGETSFFRYRSHREALLRYVVPRLIEENRQRCSLRIWSAGCSTGEEPYSLAILLLENFPELANWDVQILATDINKRALRHAREASYGERSLRMMEQPLRDRYFEKKDAHYFASRQVRNMVHFQYLNLQTDPFPQEIDLLLCRNVLIYFELETIRRIVANFSNSLKQGGFLFMGHSETMQNVSTRFQRHHQHNAFFYQLKADDVVEEKTPAAVVSKAPDATNKKKIPAKPRQEEPPSLRPEEAAGKIVPRDLDALYRDAVKAFDHERFVDADLLLDELLQQQPGHAQALVSKGLLLANQGKYSDARILCARAIKENDLLPEAYLLRGLILDMEGFLERALVEYQKVLWLDSAFVMAHYLSAKIHNRLADAEKKQRSLRNVVRVLEKYEGQADIPFSGGLSRGVFLEIVRQELAES